MHYFKCFKLFFISLGCALFLTACGGSDTPEAVAQDFVKALTSGDVDKVLKLMDMSNKDAKELEKMRPKAEMMFAKIKKDIDAQGGVKSIKAVGTEISEDGNTAKVMVQLETVTGKGGNTKPVRLKKVDGKWKVSK